MLEQRGSGSGKGSPHPVLMDFGLARQTSEQKGLTRSGMVMGSPAYMSPEQARGETRELDRRTDVYSLGAMLYEVVTGRPPLEGSSTVETLVQVLFTEPEPLRRVAPGVAPDLETIVMKCLDKDPTRRYPSARALASDLYAYLAGEPIAAQPPSLRYRLGKQLRRHRALVAVAAAALLPALVAGGAVLRTQARAVRQIELAQQFGESAREVETLMRLSHMSPLHDLRPARAQAAQRLQRIYAQMAGAGAAGAGPGNYALGRSYLALGEYHKAYEHLLRARRSGFRFSGLDHVLGRAMEQLYRRGKDPAGPDHAPASTPAAEAQNAADLDEWADLDHIERYLKAKDPADPGAPLQDAEYVDGLLAYDRGDYAQALEKIREVTARLPWLYEERVLEGDVHRQLGRKALAAGDADAAVASWRRAENAYATAAALGRSDPEVYLHRARLWQERAAARMDVDADADAALGDSHSRWQWLAACTAAQIADPAREDDGRLCAEAARAPRGAQSGPSLASAQAEANLAQALRTKP